MGQLSVANRTALDKNGMQPDEINPKLLEQTLRALRLGQTPPVEILNLRLLEKTNSQTKRTSQLFELLISIGSESLELHRQMAGLPHLEDENLSREDQLVNLATDFSIGDPELESWSALYHRYLSPNTLRVSELANAAHVAPRQYRRRVERGVSHLVTALRQAEMESPPPTKNRLLSRHLPPPDYIKLFGIEETLDLLLQVLTTPEGPKFVSLEGLGGIGKTALAQAVAWRMAEKGTVNGIPWISARHEWLSHQGVIQKLADPVQSVDDIIARLTIQLGQEQLAGLPTTAKLERLQALLTNEPHLVVIDNLESMKDVEALIPALYPLAGATRFLLTSRTTLRNFQFIQVFPINELSQENSQALLESELKRRGRNQKIPQKDMHALYETIGGHPLALKLASAQMGSLPVDHILKGLREAHQKGPESLYTYIYRQTWQLLEDSAKKLLLSMLMVSPDGESLDWIQIMSALPSGEFDQALAQLLDYSLLEVGGKLDMPYYRLHRLTVTFLQTDILSTWQSRKS